MSYHPSDITLRENYCGYAITLKKQGAQRDRNIFQVGVAAHAVLEEIGKATKINPDINVEQVKQIADNVTHELCTKGRAYDNVPEPPMKISQAIEGAKIAIKYLRFNQLDPDANYEQPFAFDKDWNPVDYYHNSAAFRTLIDYLHIYEDTNEDGETFTTAIIRDYKSSWYLTTEMLDNLQRRAQGLVVYLANPNIDLILLQIHGLRNNQKLERKIYTQHEQQLINEWKNDIEISLKALNETQIPNPGIACHGCPYAATCEHAINVNEKKIVDQYVALLAVAKELEKQIRILTKETTLKTDKGSVGYSQKERMNAQKDAIHTLWETWQEQNGSIDAFLNTIKLTSTDAKKIIRALAKNGIDYDTMAEQCLTKKSYSQFGITKT